MNKTEDDQIVTREVGERVDFALGLDQTSTKDLGNGVLEAVVTTSAVDRHNENIETSGIDTKTFMDTGGVVLYGHDYSGLPIGKTLKLTEMKNKMKAQFQLAVEEYPFAATVYSLIKGGYINAVSIGGIVREWSQDYRTILKMEMVEFSVVPVPANAQAIITSRSIEKMTGKTVDTIKAEYQDFARKNMLDKLSDIPEDEAIDAISTLKMLVDRLEETTKNRKLNDDPNVRTIKRYVLKDAQAVQTQSQKIIKIIKFSKD